MATTTLPSKGVDANPTYFYTESSAGEVKKTLASAYATLTGTQTITALKTISLGVATGTEAYALYQPTDWGTGKPRLQLDKGGIATYWSFALWDGTNYAGTINFNATTALTWNGSQLIDAGSTQTISASKTFSLPPRLPSYTVGTVPSAATYARGMIYVSDGTSNKRFAVSDGTNWRWPDGAIVS